MKIYITGATGFVGSHVVKAAIGRGHDVIAVVRPSSSASIEALALPGDQNGQNSQNGQEGPAGTIDEARVDLRSRRGLAESLAGVDVVIHLAAAKSGDFYTQFAGTVVATENLLAAMAEADAGNLVGISTFSVYDYLNARPGTLIDEDSPLDQSPALRDEYAQTKLIQETLYRRFGETDGNRQVIIRPGMIYGADNLWHALLGAELGPRFLRIGSKAILPLTYVENCAEAMVLTAEKLVEPDSTVDGTVINIVDDDLPTQSSYAELVADRMETPPSISVPWPAMRTAAGLLKKGNEIAFDGRIKFPGIAVPDRLHARFKPLRYTNRRAKDLLGWSPRYDLATAIDRSVAAQVAAESGAGA
ncbi:MAG: NAD-dependent epimerase/dehydratase family protein [Acidimicrobiales bacterium]